MATALIRIDQAANTQPIGLSGIARRDLILGQPVTLRNSDDTDVNRWRWRMVDQPLGSTATLSAVDSPQVTFTPDVDGSYLVELAVNDGLFGEIDQRVAAVEDSQGRRVPATEEVATATNFAPPTLQGKGWGKDAEEFFRTSGVAVETYNYASTGVFETIKDLGEFPEDQSSGFSIEITAGVGQPGLAFAGFVQLRGTAYRASGFAPSETSQVLTSGNLPGNTAQLLISGNNLLLQYRTTLVDDVEVAFSITQYDTAIVT